MAASKLPINIQLTNAKKKITDLQAQIQLLQIENLDIKSQFEQLGKSTAVINTSNTSAVDSHNALKKKYADMKIAHENIKNYYETLHTKNNEFIAGIKERLYLNAIADMRMINIQLATAASKDKVQLVQLKTIKACNNAAYMQFIESYIHDYTTLHQQIINNLTFLINSHT
jgi:hypothetical protein